MKWIFWLFLAACSGDKGGDSSSDSATSTTDSNTTDSGTDSGTTEGDVKPMVVQVTTAACSTNSSNPDAPEDSWLFTIAVDDPQGTDTVRAGTMTFKKGAKELASLALACRSGSCAGSTRSSIDGVTCDLAGNLTVIFVVTDTDEHESEPFSYQTEPV